MAKELCISINPQLGAPKEVSVHTDVYNEVHDNYYESFAETAPLAICRTALKSCKVIL
ncbi:hypothetical protein D3C84_704010 [compost metagenome]